MNVKGSVNSLLLFPTAFSFLSLMFSPELLAQPPNSLRFNVGCDNDPSVGSVGDYTAVLPRDASGGIIFQNTRGYLDGERVFARYQAVLYKRSVSDQGSRSSSSNNFLLQGEFTTVDPSTYTVYTIPVPAYSVPCLPPPDSAGGGGGGNTGGGGGNTGDPGGGDPCTGTCCSCTGANYGATKDLISQSTVNLDPAQSAKVSESKVDSAKPLALGVWRGTTWAGQDIN